ncbi:MAG: SRPBCC domain-containing protein [Xanthomonadales bacterium]|nr:SRPBCC domain-containing protein [Xanthomonadales bacterium]
MRIDPPCLMLLVAIWVFPPALAAEVKAVSANGFTVQHSIATPASPDDAFQAMTRIGQWWNPDHSWSGQAENLYMDARPGGCFCERLPDGGVEHLRIVYLAPGKEIRFDGALGPLQSMAVNGRMIWTIATGDDSTSITFTYHVMGFMDGGFEGLAPAVDGVIAEQLDRLGAFLSPPEA